MRSFRWTIRLLPPPSPDRSVVNIFNWASTASVANETARAKAAEAALAARISKLEATSTPPVIVPPVPPVVVPPVVIPPVIVPPVPVLVGWPDATNTGVPGTAPGLTPAPGFRTSKDGQVIESLDIAGSVYVDHNNVTIRNCRIVGDGGSTWAVDIGRNGGVTGLLVTDCELDGNRSDQGGIRSQSNGSQWIGKRLNIHNGENGARPGGNAILVDCYLHSNASSASAPHYDGIEVYEGTNTVIRHCTVQLDKPQTSAINAQGDFGTVTGLVIDSCLLGGGGWVLNIRKIGAHPVTGTVITNNTFADKGGFGYGAIDAVLTTITGNVDATGNNIDSQI